MKKTFLIAVIFFLFLNSAQNLFAGAITHVSPLEGIDWTFETTMGFQNLGNMLMSKEGNSSTQSREPLFFYGILYHAYYNKLPMIKAQMNLGFNEKTSIYWTENPDFNHDNQSLNEKLRCVEVDVQWPLPSLRGIRGVWFPFLGYTFLNYSSSTACYGNSMKSFKFHAFAAGVEYNRKVSRAVTLDYYFSFAPLMLTNSGEPSYFYYNYGTEVIINSYPIAVTFFAGFRNGFEPKKVKVMDKTTYTFSNSEIGISFHMNLKPIYW